MPDDFETFAIYDHGEGRAMGGIPSFDAAVSVAKDYYFREPETCPFTDDGEPISPAYRVIVEPIEGEPSTVAMLRHDDKYGWHWGSIARERRCRCCHQVRRHTDAVQDP